MKTIRNLLFDLDGTLVDSSRTISASLEYALGRLEMSTAGHTPMRSVIGRPLLDIFRDEYEMTDEQAESAIFHYREHYDSLAQAGTRVYDRVHEVLSTLRIEGFRLFIATVKPTAIAEKVLRDLDLKRYFDGIAGASMSHERRDKASIIAYALQSFGLDPLQSLMIGDRDQDIIGARQNGMHCIAVTYGFGSRDELVSALPVHVADHSGEIVSFLLNPSHAK
jgi:phosphoglycolate phosphatase